MQFGKKSRNLAAVGRRFFRDRAQDDAPSAQAAVQEPPATAYEEMAMTPPAPEESMVAGDPTQRLLTSLGRFQRQVSRAEEGASQDAWCDECMNQLIAGIEIALNESWADVKEALTDTARVLQTYEDADMASDCVPFLKDSYEILCLMVGDLIVDNVRSGVMKKWHERYERALNELANIGLTLVDDDSTRDRDTEDHGIDTPDPFGPESAPEATQSAHDGSAFDAFINETGASQQSESSADESDPFSSLAGNVTPFGVPQAENGSSAMAELPSLDELLGGEEPEDMSTLELTNDFTADEPGRFGGSDEPDAAPFASSEASGVPAFAKDLFDGDGEADDSEIVDDEIADEAEVSDVGIFAAEPEVEEVVEEVAEEVLVAPPAPVAPVEAEPEPGSAQALLKTAQQAMAMGNVADAKMFALQLAANMARLEAEQVEARADAIKAQIDANVEEIAAAERTVSDAEERLRSLEEQVSEYQKEFDGKCEHINHVRGEVAAAEESVADLDRQIAELEGRRDEERGRLADRQTNLDDSIAEENRMQAELDALGEEVGGARENLGSARERVQALQESGGGHEAALEAARNELSSKQSAVEDIERTLGYIGGGARAVEEAPMDNDGGESGGHDEHGE